MNILYKDLIMTIVPYFESREVLLLTFTSKQNKKIWESNIIWKFLLLRDFPMKDINPNSIIQKYTLNKNNHNRRKYISEYLEYVQVLQINNSIYRYPNNKCSILLCTNIMDWYRTYPGYYNQCDYCNNHVCCKHSRIKNKYIICIDCFGIIKK